RFGRSRPGSEKPRRPEARAAGSRDRRRPRARGHSLRPRSSPMKQLTPLALGADVVTRLLPHRRPFLMVDSIEAYARTPRPALRAARSISANEPIFEGHFPGLALWPGVYTIEGMGQTCNLLRILIELERGFVEAGRDAGEVVASLENLELGYRFHP